MTAIMKLAIAANAAAAAAISRNFDGSSQDGWNSANSSLATNMVPAIPPKKNAISTALVLLLKKNCLIKKFYVINEKKIKMPLNAFVLIRIKWQNVSQPLYILAAEFVLQFDDN